MIRVVIAAPFLFLMILFALSNPQPVRLGLWPTDYGIDIPLSIAVLIAMAVAFIFGALLLWMSAVGARMRARRAERSVRQLQTQLQELRGRVSQPVMPPSMSSSTSLTLTR